MTRNIIGKYPVESFLTGILAVFAGFLTLTYYAAAEQDRVEHAAMSLTVQIPEGQPEEVITQAIQDITNAGWTVVKDKNSLTFSRPERPPMSLVPQGVDADPL